MGLHKGQSNKGSFKPGESGNPAGRPKGSKNRFSKEVKETFRKVFGLALASMEKDLKDMPPDKRWKIILAGLKYVMPTKQQVDTKIQGEMKIDVQFEDFLSEELSIDEPKED